MRTLVMTALAVSLTLSLWGCEEESTEEVGEETAEVASPPEAEAEPAAAEAPVEGETPAEPSAEEAAEMAQAVEEAVDEAAAGAEAGGGGNCEQAFDEISGMIAAMQKQMGKGPGQENMPSKEQFVSGCESLPENVQQCMRLSYGMQHQQECQQALNALTPEQKSRAQELMGR